MKTILGITGASGAAFALDFLKRLKGHKELIVTQWGRRLLLQELGMGVKELEAHADRAWSDADLAAPCSSGSHLFDALVILPCSAGTLNKIACGICDTLLTRTALVALKERRKLVLCLRETPLSTQTLRHAAQLSADGAVIMPPLPPFYTNPPDLPKAVEGFSFRLLQVLGQESGSLWKTKTGVGLAPE